MPQHAGRHLAQATYAADDDGARHPAHHAQDVSPGFVPGTAAAAL